MILESRKQFIVSSLHNDLNNGVKIFFSFVSEFEDTFEFHA